MWLCENRLKGKTAHFRLPSASQNRACLRSLLGSFSNDNGDGNENVTNLHIRWAKTIALHALHVRFSFLSISLPSSASSRRYGERQHLEINFHFSPLN